MICELNEKTETDKTTSYQLSAQVCIIIVMTTQICLFLRNLKKK